MVGMRRSLVAVVVAALIAPFALSGCGDKQKPAAAAPPSVSSGAKVTSVTLTDSKGKAVAGALRDDGSSWVPGKTLKTKETYAASVVATSDSGLTKTVRTTFTTMGAPARKTG